MNFRARLLIPAIKDPKIDSFGTVTVQSSPQVFFPTKKQCQDWADRVLKGTPAGCSVVIEEFGWKEIETVISLPEPDPSL